MRSAGSIARRVPARSERAPARPGHVGEHGVDRDGHDRHVDREGQHEPGVLAQDELRPADRLGEQRVDAAALDFFRDEADANEDGDEEAEDSGRRQSEILDDLDVLPGGELPEQIRRGNQQDRKEDQVVEDAVPDRLAEHADGDAANRAHERPPGPDRAEPASATRRTKKSSSVSRIGLSDTGLAPIAARSASTFSGGESSDSSTA